LVPLISGPTVTNRSVYIQYRACAALANLSFCEFSAHVIDEKKGFDSLGKWVSPALLSAVANVDKSHVYPTVDTFLNSTRSHILAVQRFGAFSAAVLAKKRAHRELLIASNFVQPLLILYTGSDTLAAALAAEALIEIEPGILRKSCDSLQWSAIVSTALLYVHYTDIDDEQKVEEMKRVLPEELWTRIVVVGKLLLSDK